MGFEVVTCDLHQNNKKKGMKIYCYKRWEEGFNARFIVVYT